MEINELRKELGVRKLATGTEIIELTLGAEVKHPLADKYPRLAYIDVIRRIREQVLLWADDKLFFCNEEPND